MMRASFRLLAVLLLLAAPFARAWSLDLPGGLGDALAPAPADAPAAPALPAAPLPVEPAGPFTASIFFTALEIDAIHGAATGGRLTRKETLAVDENGKGQEQGPRVPTHRFLKLGGVVYRGEGDWVVWMNGQKVTPDALMPEMLEIQVHDSSRVSLKWYDAGLGQIFYITLRPHQVYDVLTGILLPGSQAQ